MDRYRVKLKDWEPGDTSAYSGGKEQAPQELDRLRQSLVTLQETLWAEKRRSVLVILQAMDTGGKDGTISHVLTGLNPQGVYVQGFGVPSTEELEHDYLWRAHEHTPQRGKIGVFNRSYYEDVLVVRVHELVPKGVWSRRYDHINAFERLLSDEGTTVLKFFLNISKAEQKQRLEERLAQTDKRWKFNPDDLAERRLWDKYQEAYEVVLSRTSTEYAPWYIVPSDHKWYRNLVVSSALANTMQRMDLQVPKITFDPQKVRID
ncbi:MAG: polyphosphate kinase 2 family protein [Actinobacteria bacterium]|nr:polyphosphate kinase 2 family protein [Actinomycetota bacterium]